MKIQSGFVAIYLSIALVVIIVLLLFMFNKLPVVTKELSSTPNPTLFNQIDKWKHYIDHQYKFSLDYPSNLNVQQSKNNSSLIFSSEYKPPFSDYYDFSITVHKVQTDTILRNWLDNYIIQDLPSNKKGSIVSGDINIYKNNNIEGYYFVGGKESEHKYIFFKHSSFIYEIVLNGSGTGVSYKENPQGEKLLDQILSTFKFIN